MLPLRLVLLTLAVASLTAAENGRGRWETAFAAADGNRDGVLDRGEVEAIATAVSLATGREVTAAGLLRRYDGDGDGKVSRTELGLPAEAVPRVVEAPPGTRVEADIPYHEEAGVAPALLSLDIYRPLAEADAPLPVVIYVHGGGWRIGDKARVGLKPTWLCGKGFLLVSVNYRLTPAVVHPGHIQDVARAVAWVHGHIGEHGGDPARLFVMGHSAGAHLAALVATDARRLATHELTPAIFKGAILLDGAGYDIPKRIDAGGPRGRALFEAAFTRDAAVQRDASPVTHVAADAGIPPFLITHSSQRAAARDQATDLAAALEAAGIPHRVAAFDKDHAGMNADAGKEGDPLTAAIEGFLEDPAAKPGTDPD